MACTLGDFKPLNLNPRALRLLGANTLKATVQTPSPDILKPELGTLNEPDFGLLSTSQWFGGKGFGVSESQAENPEP